MKKANLLSIPMLVCLAGCSAPDNSPPPASAMLNPTAAPRSPEEKATVDARRLAGEKSNEEMSKAAQAFAAAKERAGGK